MKKITVCNGCLCASCWQGVLVCHTHKESGTTQKTIKELEELGIESPEYWV